MRQSQLTRDDFLAFYRSHIARDSKPYPDVLDALAALRERGAAVGVVTNKIGDLTIPLLDELRMLDTFQTVIAGDSAGKPKPAPEPVLMACAEIGLEPDPGENRTVRERYHAVHTTTAAVNSLRHRSSCRAALYSFEEPLYIHCR